MDLGAKQDFVAMSSEALGSDLAKTLQENIVRSITHAKTTEFTAGGTYKDEAFFKDKYKDSKDKMNNIFNNGKSMVCPVTKETLWQDPEYHEESKDT